MRDTFTSRSFSASCDAEKRPAAQVVDDWREAKARMENERRTWTGALSLCPIMKRDSPQSTVKII
jgi:hypothetical protein